jgi:hypothetical protein
MTQMIKHIAYREDSDDGLLPLNEYLEVELEGSMISYVALITEHHPHMGDCNEQERHYKYYALEPEDYDRIFPDKIKPYL